MNKDFSRAITLLRKERNLSQKQVASDLGVSQALLSHYEKGIREPGLQFLIRAADYYEVSADFLLGRTLTKGHPSEESEGAFEKEKKQTPSLRLLSNTLSLIYDLLISASNRKLTRNVSQLLMLCEYKILRDLFSGGERQTALFSASEETYRGYSTAAILKLFADIEAQSDISSPQYVEKLRELNLSESALLQEYPDFAPSVFNVISHSENTIAKLK